MEIPEKKTIKKTPLFSSGELPVMEHYYTVQGEGAYTGSPAYFIRLAGCDVGCVWCDVKESWEVDERQVVNTGEVVKAAAGCPARMAVITGGEPLMYDLKPLTYALKKKGFRVHLETSGAHFLSGRIDWVCLSPKKFKSPPPGVYAHADELKVVIYNKMDFKWAEEQAAKVSGRCRLFLQPEWSKRNQMLPQITAYVKAHPKWEISLQSHKYMGLP